MTSRFASNLLLAIGGAFLVVATFAFSLPTLRWLTFAIACAAVVTVAFAFAFRGRGPVQRVLDLLAALAGGWTIIASLTFSGGVLRWLCFSGGAALWGLAIAGLIVHEVSSRIAVRGAAQLPRSGAVQAELREQRTLSAA